MKKIFIIVFLSLITQFNYHSLNAAAAEQIHEIKEAETKWTELYPQSWDHTLPLQEELEEHLTTILTWDLKHAGEDEKKRDYLAYTLLALMQNYDKYDYILSKLQEKEFSAFYLKAITWAILLHVTHNDFSPQTQIYNSIDLKYFPVLKEIIDMIQEKGFNSQQFGEFFVGAILEIRDGKKSKNNLKDFIYLALLDSINCLFTSEVTAYTITLTGELIYFNKTTQEQRDIINTLTNKKIFDAFSLSAIYVSLCNTGRIEHNPVISKLLNIKNRIINRSNTKIREAEAAALNFTFSAADAEKNFLELTSEETQQPKVDKKKAKKKKQKEKVKQRAQEAKNAESPAQSPSSLQENLIPTSPSNYDQSEDEDEDEDEATTLLAYELATLSISSDNNDDEIKDTSIIISEPSHEDIRHALVQTLIAKGYNPNEFSSLVLDDLREYIKLKAWEKLFRAATTGQTKLLRPRTAHDSNILTIDNELKNSKIVELFNIQDKATGNTILHQALLCKNFDFALRLMSFNSCNLALKNNDKKTAAALLIDALKKDYTFFAHRYTITKPQEIDRQKFDAMMNHWYKQQGIAGSLTAQRNVFCIQALIKKIITCDGIIVTIPAHNSISRLEILEQFIN